MRKKIEGLKYKKTSGRVKVLKACLYKGHKVIIRMIGRDYFEYLVEYNGEIYSSYIIIKPAGVKKTLTDSEISECAAMIYTGAEATIDALLNDIDDNGDAKIAVEMLESIEKDTENK